MNNEAAIQRPSQRGKCALVLSGLLAFLALQTSARATPFMVFNFSMNTVGLENQVGYFAFDLFNGNGVPNEFAAKVTGFSVQGVGGFDDPLTDVDMVDIGFPGSDYKKITFGTSLSFSLLFESLPPPPVLPTPNSSPDSFVASILTEDYTNPLFLDPFDPYLVKTNAPGGTHALFAIDITGNSGGDVFRFDPSPQSGVSWTLTPQTSVPESGATLFLLFMSMGSVGLVRLVRGLPGRSSRR